MVKAGAQEQAVQAGTFSDRPQRKAPAFEQICPMPQVPQRSRKAAAENRRDTKGLDMKLPRISALDLRPLEAIVAERNAKGGLQVRVWYAREFKGLSK